jgi:NitT/TauT family transport system substrate-binding protein
VRRTRSRAAVVLAAFGLVSVAACGSDDGGSSSTTGAAATTAAPATTEAEATTAAASTVASIAADATATTASGVASTTAAPLTMPPGDPVKVSVRLNVGSWGTYHAGMAIAQTKGWYTDAGLDPTFGIGTGSLPTAQQIASGTDDIAFTSADAVSKIAALDGGLEMFANIMPDAGNCLMVKPDSGIASPKDMAGKTIGDSAGFVTLSVMPALWNAVDVDVDSVNVITVDPASRMQGWLSGSYDGLPSFVFAEPVQADMQFGQKSTCFMLSDYGINLVGYGLVAKTSFVEEHHDLVATFADVTMRGYEYAFAHPDEAADAIRELGDDAPTLAPAEQIVAGLSILSELALVDADSGKPYGYSSPERWASMIETMTTYGGLDPKVVATDLYTNELYE